ncbi:MAG TPA: hypothetical protein VF048_00120, partial [Gemmatimonadaceae bacterium]
MPRTVVALAALTVAAAAVAAPTSLTAQVTAGSTLTFTGTTSATDVGGDGVRLDFAKHVLADPSANTGSFAPLNKEHGISNGSIESLVVGSGLQPINRVVHFGPYRFDLERLPSGAYGQADCYVMPAPGQRCTPYQLPSYELSPFYLENVAGSDGMFTALISFDVAGTVTARGISSPFTGTITARFDGLSYQEALAGLEQFGMKDVPFTATFTVGGASARVPAAALAPAAAAASVVPEPSS